MGIRLAAVFAHPDDDTYGLAGTLAMEGNKIDYTLIVATSGEAGVKELLLGAFFHGVLGVKDPSVDFLRYPDSGLSAVPRDELVGRITDLLRSARPHVVVTFGPEGITRHDDHIAVGQAATEAFHRARGPGTEADAFQRLYYVAIPQSELDRFWNALRARGADIGDPEGPFMPRGVPDESIAVRVDCREVLRRKLDAIRAHRTQQSELEDLPEDLQPEMFGVECFVMAWPPPETTDETVRRSLLDGLSV